ncbi:MAG: hypothetical protein HUK08_01995 [Bacteroidaceae bacterium]|nr:hypothetical protein [Bacteroidaceae bacterium]
MEQPRTIKRAYNTIIYNGITYRQAIAEYTADGKLLQVYEFNEEEPFVEWIGGTLEVNK